MSRLAAIALLAVLGCAAPVDPPEQGPERGRDQSLPTERQQKSDPEPEQPAVTEQGISGFEVVTVSSGAVERDADLEFFHRPLTDSCSVAWDDSAGLGVVIDDKTLVLAFLIRSREYRTYGGIGVGSTIDEIVTQFGGSANVLDIPSQDGGGPLVEVAPTGNRGGDARGMYFRTGSDRRVTEYRVGLWPWVEYDEYCLPSEAQRAAG